MALFMIERQPDINKPDEIVDAISQIEVLGGFSRSYSEGPNGECEPERYLERLGDYFTITEIRAAVALLFKKGNENAEA